MGTGAVGVDSGHPRQSPVNGGKRVALLGGRGSKSFIKPWALFPHGESGARGRSHRRTLHEICCIG
jgi:hypothetical protein